MSYASVQSCTLVGITAIPVTVEVHLAGGLPGMSIVGLPQSAVRESKDRVRSAIKYLGLKFPQCRIVVNLAPADIPKQGGRFDLPIALGILQASHQLPDHVLDELVVLGELGLTGELRAVSGVLPVAYCYADSQWKLFVPLVNLAEALRSQRTHVIAASTLAESIAQLGSKEPGLEQLVLLNRATASKPQVNPNPLLVPDTAQSGSVYPVADKLADGLANNMPNDMADVIGQHHARRALEIAAAGGHNLLMVGPPGTGKSMLARRLPGLQPQMTEAEALQSASVASISYRGFDISTWGVRPFREPHHTASAVALVGGGAVPMPGEISLAHHGVLFLDELPEFSRRVLEVLREPMETGSITVSRAARQAHFPARFQLVAAMNSCPCGYHGDSEVHCRCTPDAVQRYRDRISGPFLDRIDLRVEMHREVRVSGSSNSTSRSHSGPDKDVGPGESECSELIRKRVVAARQVQLHRQGAVNAHLDLARLKAVSGGDMQVQNLLNDAVRELRLSLRAEHRVLRVARTLADMAGTEQIGVPHLAEALSYRQISFG